MNLPDWFLQACSLQWSNPKKMKFSKTETLRSDLVGFDRASSNLQTEFQTSKYFCPTSPLQISACRVSGSGSGSGFLVFWFSANPNFSIPGNPDLGMKNWLHREIRLIKASWSVLSKIQNSNLFQNPNFGVTSSPCPCTVRKGVWAHNLLNFYPFFFINLTFTCIVKHLIQYHPV